VTVARHDPTADPIDPVHPAGAPGLPVLLRAVDPGPAPDGAPTPAAGWCAPLLRGLPVLTTPVPVVGARGPAGRRVPHAPVTEAQAHGLARTAARVVFDVLEGRRPEQQLDGLFTEWAASAVRAMRRGGLRWPVRGATLESVHVRLPTALAIEASVVFRSDGRHRALALRLDRDRHRWLATAVRIA
jgi:hypothetical protein